MTTINRKRMRLVKKLLATPGTTVQLKILVKRTKKGTDTADCFHVRKQVLVELLDTEIVEDDPFAKYDNKPCPQCGGNHDQEECH